ncbi:VPLPA-CTERM sorting domain-containing protein [Pseudomonadales bacterium]|nr:VPLPA-CTERM sorting domain-containing protein [Pseudomonadales bacterium]
MKPFLLRFVACLFLCVSIQASASFYDIKVEASGILTYVDQDRFPSLSEGDTWSSTTIFEDAWFWYQGGHAAEYQVANASGTFQIGEHVSNPSRGFGGKPPLKVSKCVGCLDELYFLWGYSDYYFIDGNQMGWLSLRLESGLNPASLINTNRTDLEAVINDFEFHLPNSSIMTFDNRIGGSVQNFSVTIVPLPAGIYLFLSGLVGLGLMRGRNG